MMFETAKRWAQARMAPETWDRMRRSIVAANRSARGAAGATKRWALVGSDHVTSMRSARVEGWRLLFASAVIVAVALALGFVDPDQPVSIPLLALLVCIAMSTYVADWIGGATALATAVVCLDLIFLGESRSLDVASSLPNVAVLATFMATCIVAIVTIERLKYDRASARLESAALRAANSALSAVEIAAARRPPGDRDAYVRVLSSILTAMVRINRASAGALYLLDSSTATLVRAAAYGDDDAVIDSVSPRAADNIPIGVGLAGRLAQERRTIAVFDVHEEPGFEDVMANNPYVRAAAGVPIIGPGDQLVGVAWVGLYVPYRFAQTAIARLQGLAHRTIAFVEAARLADDQDALLDRVQDNHRRLQSVIQTIPEAVMVARPPIGQIVASNAAAQRMFGLAQDGRIETRRADQLPIMSDGNSDTPSPIQRALLDGEVVTGAELAVRAADGRTIPVVAAAAPLRSEDGAIDAVVAIFQDVSPLKEAERLRDEFVSVVSHELRSPLTPIRGFAQVVARDLQREGGHDQHVDWLVTLQRHVDRMTRLVDDLLDVSRLRAGRLMIRKGPADVVQIGRSIVESRNATSDQHRVVLETDLDDAMLDVDADRIHQVIDNLVGNAIKYAPTGTVRVAIEKAGESRNQSLRITVSDDGEGIPRAEHERLFSPFFRTRTATESAVPGLGLGLFICRELVLAHDGSIEVGTSPSGGARFTVSLPAAA